MRSGSCLVPVGVVNCRNPFSGPTTESCIQIHPGRLSTGVPSPTTGHWGVTAKGRSPEVDVLSFSGVEEWNPGPTWDPGPEETRRGLPTTSGLDGRGPSRLGRLGRLDLQTSHGPPS